MLITVYLSFFYRWFRGSSPIYPSGTSWLVGGSLVLASAVATDAGEYHCMANNSVGTSRYTTQLSITVPLSVQVN